MYWTKRLRIIVGFGALIVITPGCRSAVPRSNPGIASNLGKLSVPRSSQESFHFLQRIFILKRGHTVVFNFFIIYVSAVENKTEVGLIPQHRCN